MSRFNSVLARWEAAGTKPPDSTLENGWLAGTKPPADWFNWFFNSTYQALNEIQDLAALNSDLVDHVTSLDNPHQVTKTQIGLGDVENFGIASVSEAKAGVVTNKLMTPASVLESIKEQFKTQNILYQGSAYPGASTYTFLGSQKVSEQNLGILLVWSDYDPAGNSGSANNYNFDFTFIPKWFVSKYSGGNVNVPVATNANTSTAYITVKTLYITNTTFSGHELNSTGLYANDVVLRFVLGV
ncbi:hypothetical protein IA806_02520 [Listeria seeligeri]|uniref:hypothetical protein n=1 Tax=Listeria seeligeri TaxID=1640 RepID=UPI001887A0A7|nr:hypothetical protein [Listeria seeligeri]MBF2345438.1 hypothetical protein [Listeria seeligeri]